MKNEESQFRPLSKPSPPWPLYQAVAIGLLGAISALLALGLISTSVRFAGLSRQLSHRRFIAVETVLECIVTIGATYSLLAVLRGPQLRGFWKSIQWNRSNSLFSICLGIGLISSVLMRYFLVGVSASSPFSINGLSSQLDIYAILSTAILQPLIEEIYYRGILFEALSFKVGPIFSIIIVTVIFTLVHVHHQWVVLPISIVLAVTRIATRSTANCFALHAAYNLGMILWGLS